LKLPNFKNQIDTAAVYVWHKLPATQCAAGKLHFISCNSKTLSHVWKFFPKA